MRQAKLDYYLCENVIVKDDYKNKCTTYAESDFKTCRNSAARSPVSSSTIELSLPAKSTRESLLYKFSPVIKLL